MSSWKAGRRALARVGAPLRAAAARSGRRMCLNSVHTPCEPCMRRSAIQAEAADACVCVRRRRGAGGSNLDEAEPELSVDLVANAGLCAMALSAQRSLGAVFGRKRVVLVDLAL